jgi:hypothetical protein
MRDSLIPKEGLYYPRCGEAEWQRSEYCAEGEEGVFW